MTHEGYWSVAIWNYNRVFPRLQYEDNLGLHPYGRNLIFHEAFVEHCQQPPMAERWEFKQIDGLVVCTHNAQLLQASQSLSFK